MVKSRYINILLILLCFSGSIFAQEIDYLGSILSCSGADNLAIVGSCAYISNSNGWGVTSLDLADPENLDILNTYPFEHTRRYLDAENDILISCFSMMSENGFKLFEIDQGEIIEELSYTQLTDDVSAVLIDQNFCYVSSPGGLHIYDISNPRSPNELSVTPEIGGAYKLTKDNGFLAMAFGDVCYIIDISDPNDPIELATLLSGQSEGNFQSADIEGDFLYTAGWYGLRIYSLEDPTDPILTGAYNGYDNYSRAVKVVGDVACLSNGWDGVVTLDISDPANPVYLGFIQTPGFVRCIETLNDSTVVFTDYDVGLMTVDISSPDNPVERGRPDHSGRIDGGVIDDDYAYLHLSSNRSFTNKMLVVDYSTDNPMLVNNGFEIDHSIIGGTKVGNYLHTLDSYAGDWNITHSAIHTYDITNPLEPVYMNEVSFGPAIRDYTIRDEFLYLLMHHNPGSVSESNELIIADLSDGPEPTILYHETLDHIAWHMEQLNDLLIILGGEEVNWDLDSTSFYFYDISSPEQTEKLGSQLLEDHELYDVLSMKVNGNYLYTTSYESTFDVYHYNDLTMELLTSFDMPGKYFLSHSVDSMLVAKSWYGGDVLVFDVREPSSPSQYTSLDYDGYANVISVENNPVFVHSTGFNASFYDMSSLLSIDEEVTITPDKFQIGNIYPNPFNSTVTVPFEINKSGKVTFTIYNILGQKVSSRSLYANAGSYSMPIQSEEWVSGIYTVVIEHQGQSQARKICLLK